MFLQVVRCFEDADVHHVNGKVDPAEDAETINFELALADVAQIEKRLERLKKGRAKTKEEQASNEVSVQSHICIHVTTFKPICMYQYLPRDIMCLQICVHVHAHMYWNQDPTGGLHTLCPCAWAKLPCPSLAIISVCCEYILHSSIYLQLQAGILSM